MYYNKCSYCGCYLDPGERCDCKKNTDAKNIRELYKELEKAEQSGDMVKLNLIAQTIAEMEA